MLYDNHGRRINYLRLAVTDRCNLRCFYCMPEEGIKYASKQALLTYEEMLRLVELLVQMGIEKVRITGGEPFVRKDMLVFLKMLSEIKGLKEIHLTTNGTLTRPLIADLKKIRIKSINLSLDSVNRARFYEITRRDVFEEVMLCLEALVAANIPTKINAVVMDGKNIEDLLPMVELGKKYPLSIRFIEEMPFNGTGSHYDKLPWDHRRILKHIQSKYPKLQKIPDGAYSTSANYQIPNFKGTFGIIAAYSRTFCGTCNRIRITPEGLLKTCLYDEGVFNIKNILRQGATDAEIRTTFLEALGNRAKDGFEAEKRRVLGSKISESMSTIGG